MPGFKKLIHEIHRRSLWQLMGVYLVGSFVVLQVLDALGDTIGLPERFAAVAVGLLIVGLPIVLATAIVQHGLGSPRTPRPFSDDPKGVSSDAATTAEPDAATELPARLFSWRNAILAGVVAFAIWGIVAAGWVISGSRPGTSSSEGARPSVAVLPFSDQSAEGGEEASFFANGIHDEILTQLSKISGLKVISRTSVMEYRDASRNVREIAAELGVGAVVEGAVQRAGDRVRINVQLIDATTDDHLWANTYEEELTTENIFAIQADVARQISRELRAELTPAESALLDARPTDDLEAYDFFLRGTTRVGKSYAEEDLRFGAEMFEEAVRIDPRFAVAYARLAQVHAEIYWFFYDRTPERRRMVEDAVGKARELAPDHPETHVASGVYHYRVHLDYESALRELEAARSSMPGSPLVLTTIGYIQNRMGLFELGAENVRRGLELDPNSTNIALNLGVLYQLLRDFDEARRYYDRAIRNTPAWPRAVGYRALLSLYETGETTEAREVLETGEAAGAQAAREAVMAQAWLNVLLHEGSYQALIDRIDAESWEVVRGQWVYLPASLVRAWALTLMGDEAGSRREFEAAARILEAELERTPDDARLHSALGYANAGLGRADEASASAARAVELMPTGRDAFRGAYRLADQAYIFASLGDADRAITIFEELLDQPSWVTAAYLRETPLLEDLRRNPRLVELLER